MINLTGILILSVPNFNSILSKLRSNSILSKLRYYVNKEISRAIYFPIFHSYLTYVTTIWEQARIPQKRVTVLQKKTLRIMRFAPFNSHSSSYFHDYNILKLCDIVNIEACVFINNCFNSYTFLVFTERFKLVSKSHAHNTRSSWKGRAKIA